MSEFGERAVIEKVLKEDKFDNMSLFIVKMERIDFFFVR